MLPLYNLSIIYKNVPLQQMVSTGYKADNGFIECFALRADGKGVKSMRDCKIGNFCVWL